MTTYIAEMEKESVEMAVYISGIEKESMEGRVLKKLYSRF
jgi:hypothetical protein